MSKMQPIYANKNYVAPAAAGIPDTSSGRDTRYQQQPGYQIPAAAGIRGQLSNLKCDCDQIFTSVFFPMIVKNAYKEAGTQNFSVISYILPELYDDESSNFGGRH